LINEELLPSIKTTVRRKIGTLIGVALLIDEDGNEFHLDAKIRNGKNGEFFSGKIKRKNASTPPSKQAVSLDDNIPF